MPLCTLEIPNGSALNKEQAAQLFKSMLDVVSTGLRIPDPEDRESRVIVDDSVTRPRISVSYTVGPNEYPRFPGQESFYPSDEETHRVGLTIQALGFSSSFRVSETQMKAWRDTTFMFVDRATTDSPLPEPAGAKEIGQHINQSIITLVISPDSLSSQSISPEIDPSSEMEPFDNVAREIQRMISETLGVPEHTDTWTRVILAKQADTNISLEFDCQLQDGYKIPEVVRHYVANNVATILNNSRATGNGSAEVWIRQGEPVTDIITS